MKIKSEVDPLERGSLTDPLENIYANGKSSRAPSLTDKFGMGAKLAGTEQTAANFVDLGNEIQSNFKIKQAPRSTQFTDAALNYATSTLRLDTTKYTGR